MERIQTTIKILNTDAHVFRDMAEGLCKSDYKILKESKEDFETEFFIETTTDKLFSIGRFFERFEIYDRKMRKSIKTKVRVEIPVQFKKLCQLIGVRPEDVIQSFIHDLAKSVHGSSGSDERMMATDYFLRTFYPVAGTFEYEEVESMIYELDELRRTWNNFGNQREEEYQQHFKERLEEWYLYWKKIKNKRKQKAS